jgi:hypothetical protein
MLAGNLNFKIDFASFPFVGQPDNFFLKRLQKSSLPVITLLVPSWFEHQEYNEYDSSIGFLFHINYFFF